MDCDWIEVLGTVSIHSAQPDPDSDQRVARKFHKQKPGLLKRLRKENQRTSSVLDLNRGKQKIGNWKSGLDYILYTSL